jgi:hypothetical protein
MVVAVAALASTPVLAGCSGGGGSGKTANVTPGDMPQGASWTGVYFSELYGFLHIVQDGNAIVGKWQRPHKDRWGSIKGEATGDVIHFEWTEHVTGLIGPNSEKKGKGYFKYKRPEGDNVDDQIVGEIGRDNDETGEPWDAIKQRNVNPDLDSIGGTGAGDIGGGDWDSDNKEQGSPEAPAQPQAPPSP